MKLRTLLLGVLAPLLILTGSVFAAFLMIKSRVQPQIEVPTVAPSGVRIVVGTPGTVRIDVSAEGTVTPRTESRLAAEVAGRILSISPSLRSGGFFRADEVLLTIDPTDYELAVERAGAEVAAAERVLAMELAEAEASQREWGLNEQGPIPPLAARAPQVAEAKANLAAAKAGLKQAHRDLERCSVKAPYEGRVRSKSVDMGQYVQRGETLAQVFAVDVAQVRLPIAESEFAFLDLPLDYRGEQQTGVGPAVTLTTTFAGRLHSYQGRAVRTEGELDPRTRRITVVVEVKDPYGRDARSDRPPLSAGMFVAAEIAGRTFENVIVLPRAALRGRDRVHVVDQDGRLQFRTVQILRTDRERLIVTGGLEPLARVIVNRIETVVEGMRVTVEKDADTGPANGGR